MRQNKKSKSEKRLWRVLPGQRRRLTGARSPGNGVGLPQTGYAATVRSLLFLCTRGWGRRETISEALPALRAELKSSMLLWGVHLQGNPSKAWQGVEGGQNCAQAEAPQD